MKDLSRTAIYIAVAAVLVALAWLLQPTPPSIERLSDEGELFYPNFTDPLAATSLEVIRYDENAGSAVPFKVDFAGGKWTIPSHYNYPADGQDRLANTAGAMMDLKKDIIQSDRAQDHESLGVIDPLDDSQSGVTGRGERITIRSVSGGVLADYIIGNPVPNREDFRYVRVPDKKRTFAVNVKVDASTKFSDWINADLLEFRAPDVKRLALNDYSIDEATGTFNQVGRVTLHRNLAGKWELSELTEGKQVDEAKVNAMLSALDGLTIAGVRPKPASLTADLRSKSGISIDVPTRMSLESRGFFISNDGRLLSNEGEISVGTRDGVRYTLRFGEVLIGEGVDVSAGSELEVEGESFNTIPDSGTPKENRYVFITAEFDESLVAPRPTPPPAPSPAPAVNENQGEGASADGEQTAAEPQPAPVETQPSADAIREYERQLIEWEKGAGTGREKAAKLNDRFAEWYYVISATDFQALRPSLNDLVKQAEPAPTGPMLQP